MQVIKQTKEVSVIKTKPKKFVFNVPSYTIPVHYLHTGAITLCLLVLAGLLTSIKSPEVKDVSEIIKPQEVTETIFASIQVTEPKIESIEIKTDISIEIRKKAVELLKDWHPQNRVFYRKGVGNSFSKQGNKIVVTKEEMMKYMPDFIVEEVLKNVPCLASITAAQTDIESNWFNSTLALKTNNGYGIKWIRKWDSDPTTWMKQYREGHEIAKDDSPTDKFIKFKSKWASIRFHTKFLTLLHYKKHIGKDFQGWARGLRTSGYATDKDYDKNLMDKYHKLDLKTIDKITAELRKQYIIM